MSYVAAGFALLSLYQGYMGAKAGKEGALGKADEYDLLAGETELTKKFNTDQRNYITGQRKLNTLKSGLENAGMYGLKGLKTVENMRAEGGSSGAMLGTGTPNEKIINQHIQNASQQLAIMQGTTEKLNNIQQNAVAINKMEDFKAEMRIKQLRRAADSARSGADSAFFAGMIGAFGNAGSSYIGAGGGFEKGAFKDEADSGWYDTWNV